MYAKQGLGGVPAEIATLRISWSSRHKVDRIEELIREPELERARRSERSRGTRLGRARLTANEVTSGDPPWLDLTT